MDKGKNKIIVLMPVCVCILLTLCGCTTIKKAKEESEKIVESYNSGHIDYDVALNNLTDIETDKQEAEQYVNEKKSYLEELKKSKDNYNTAENLFNVKKYESAITYYEHVSVNDKNYDDAQSKIVESKKRFIELTLDEAEIYIKDDKYLKAINVYREAIKVYDDGTLSGKISEVESKYKNYLENKVQEYVKDKNWSEAIGIYEELESYFNDDSYKVKKQK